VQAESAVVQSSFLCWTLSLLLLCFCLFVNVLSKDVLMEPLPSIESVNAMSNHDAVVTLRVLFEAAPVLEQFMVSIRPWKSFEDVIDKSQSFVEQLLREEKVDDVLSVLNAHPAIGADPAKLSADSKIEQGKRKEKGYKQLSFLTCFLSSH
jgi:2-oxo-4-hydroxy-4-carboxy--5-ureidoimidazoline (OHCU) decarboxylase